MNDKRLWPILLETLKWALFKLLGLPMLFGGKSSWLSMFEESFEGKQLPSNYIPDETIHDTHSTVQTIPISENTIRIRTETLSEKQGDIGLGDAFLFSEISSQDSDLYTQIKSMDPTFSSESRILSLCHHTPTSISIVGYISYISKASHITIEKVYSSSHNDICKRLIRKLQYSKNLKVYVWSTHSLLSFYKSLGFKNVYHLPPTSILPGLSDIEREYIQTQERLRLKNVKKVMGRQGPLLLWKPNTS